MGHDQAVRALAKSDELPEWARFMALAGLRSDPVEAARVFEKLASLFQARADAIRVEHLEDSGRWFSAANRRQG